MESVVIRGKRDFMALKEEWNHFALQVGYPLLSHDWVNAGISAFHRFEQLNILTVREGGDLVAVAPMVRSHVDRSSRLEIVGASHLYEPTGFLYRKPDHLDELLNRLIDMKCPFYLHNVRYGDTLHANLSRLARHHGFVLCPGRSKSPSASLDGGWEDFYASLSGRRRYDLRRAEKKALEQGGVRLEVIDPASDEIDELLARAFTIEASGWKGRNGTAIRTNPRMETFIRTFSGLVNDSGILRLCFLYIGDRPAAILIAQEYDERFWLLKVGYDEEFARCSPGILIVARSLQRAFENGLKSYEFLGAEEPWIQVWSTGSHPNLSILYYPFSMSGGIRFISDVCCASWRRILKIPGNLKGSRS